MTVTRANIILHSVYYQLMLNCKHYNDNFIIIKTNTIKNMSCIHTKNFCIIEMRSRDEYMILNI